MRKIVFRGKRKLSGDWYYGSLSIIKDISSEKRPIFSIRQQHINADDYEVIPETVGQYTGLQDRDGVDIFEGDIVRLVGIDIPSITKYEDKLFEVIYDLKTDKDDAFSDGTQTSGFCLRQINATEKSMLCFLCSSKMEVIDNIHDNKELFDAEGYV